MDGNNKEKRPPNPRAEANIFEIITFSWILKLLKTGNKKNDLEKNDLYTLLDDYKASEIGKRLEKRWKIEVDKSKNTNRSPSLFKVLAQTFGAKIMLYGLIQAFVEFVLRMSQPALIGGLLQYLNHGADAPEPKFAYMCASGLLINIFVNLLLFHYSQLELSNCGMEIRVACSLLMYKKALRSSKSSLSETTIGQAVNLLSNDLNRLDIAIRYLHFLWIGPLVMILITYVLWQIMGVSAFFGILIFLVFIPLQGWLGKKSFAFRFKTAPKTDERVKLINEIISGIQVIKMYAWEKPFSYFVKCARKMEIDQIKGATYILVIMQSFKLFHIRLTLLISFLSYVLFGNYIETENVFIIISYYGIISSTMTVFFPLAISMLGDVLITIKRVQTYLLSDEYEKTYLLCDEKHNPKSFSLKSDRTSAHDEEFCILDKSDAASINSNNVGIVVSNVSAKWRPNQSDNTLNNINLTVRPGRLVAIIGPVGAGKSSLIQSILQELPPSEGRISVYGTVSYASQEPWLFNGSVRQNILFDSPMDHERYNQVIQACSLNIDLTQLPYGDRTIVGERGASLSGGQRSRIHLARAVYKQADIYLLDDPLSAVDAQVGNHLFEKCIRGYLKEKTCLLITHQTHHLTNVDQVVLMENGNVLIEGSYQELLSSGLDFMKLLGSPETSSKASDDEKLNTDATDLESFSVISLHGSIQSLSSAADESKLNGVRSEPNEIAETHSSGKVSRSIYYSYMMAGGNVFEISFLVFICIFSQILVSGCDFWISYWVTLEDRRIEEVNSANSSVKIDDPYDYVLQWPMSRLDCIIIYAILNVSIIMVTYFRCAAFASFFAQTSKNLHSKMFNAVIRSTMHFFHSNPSGRILNRFTTDIGTVDDTLLSPIMETIYSALTILGIIVLIGILEVYLLIPTCMLGIVCYFSVRFFSPTSVSLKRLEGISRSPVISYFNASIQGLTTIRAFGAEEMLTEEFANLQDIHSSACYLLATTNEAFGFSLDIICTIYLSIIVFSFLAFDTNTYSASVGLIITQTINVTGMLQMGIRKAFELENHMTSVERILEYTNLTQEAAVESSPDKKPPKEWPEKGEVIFQNLCLRYSQDTPYVLKNLNFRIQPTEKIGIVGRTGAGKSSLIEALFRMAYNEGNIIIDGIEIHELGLHDIRSKISIIPQEPILFSGSMRKNLDPFDEYSDHALWNALEEVELKKTVEKMPDALNSIISEGGSNFSVGQRQMVCLARSVLRNNKLIVLDEATANIDTQTSSLIQNMIKDKFSSCTVLTIAHRLNTVMDCDRVLVMDAGTVVEFDHPYNLLKNKDGFFYKMVEHTGSSASDLLHGMETKNFDIENVETDSKTNSTKDEKKHTL